MNDTTSATAANGLVRRARWLAYLTIAWNAVEAVVAIAAGAAAGSLALIGFGIDSTIETMSALVVVWRLNDVSDDREERALKLIAVSFFLLAAYITVQSARDLITGSQAETSIPGITITALSLIVMPLLARAKQHVGQRMRSRVVLADAVETWLCTYLSAIVLAGLLLNATVGWWWADPVAALGVAYLALREGREAWEG
ncbi:MAG: cation transporter [Actinobacteria bacterium]|nr:cation transporter [Actinomycetota bacterium]